MWECVTRIEPVFPPCGCFISQLTGFHRFPTHKECTCYKFKSAEPHAETWSETIDKGRPQQILVDATVKFCQIPKFSYTEGGGGQNCSDVLYGWPLCYFSFCVILRGRFGIPKKYTARQQQSTCLNLNNFITQNHLINCYNCHKDHSIISLFCLCRMLQWVHEFL